MKIKHFDFVKESPDKYLHQNVDKGKRLYLPPDLVPTEKKANPKGGKDICVPTNVPAFLNNESCSDAGCMLISNGSRGRGLQKENGSAFYSYTLR